MQVMIVTTFDILKQRFSPQSWDGEEEPGH